MNKKELKEYVIAEAKANGMWYLFETLDSKEWDFIVMILLDANKKIFEEMKTKIFKLKK